MKFYERLEGLFNKIEPSQGVSRSQIIMRTGLDPAQYRVYKIDCPLRKCLVVVQGLIFD